MAPNGWMGGKAPDMTNATPLQKALFDSFTNSDSANELSVKYGYGRKDPKIWAKSWEEKGGHGTYDAAKSQSYIDQKRAGRIALPLEPVSEPVPLSEVATYVDDKLYDGDEDGDYDEEEDEDEGEEENDHDDEEDTGDGDEGYFSMEDSERDTRSSTAAASRRTRGRTGVYGSTRRKGYVALPAGARMVSAKYMARGEDDTTMHSAARSSRTSRRILYDDDSEEDEEDDDRYDRSTIRRRRPTRSIGESASKSTRKRVPSSRTSRSYPDTRQSSTSRRADEDISEGPRSRSRGGRSSKPSARRRFVDSGYEDD